MTAWVLWHCWLGSRKGIRPVKTEQWGTGSWCYYHSPSLASEKSRLVLPFWYRLTRVVPDKGPLNGCVCVCVWPHNEWQNAMNVTHSCMIAKQWRKRSNNLIFASDWQQFAHHVNWRKTDEEAQNISLAITIISIVLATTGMETSPLSWSPWIAEFVVATWRLQVAYIVETTHTVSQTWSAMLIKL